MRARAHIRTPVAPGARTCSLTAPHPHPLTDSGMQVSDHLPQTTSTDLRSPRAAFPQNAHRGDAEEGPSSLFSVASSLSQVTVPAVVPAPSQSSPEQYPAPS